MTARFDVMFRSFAIAALAALALAAGAPEVNAFDTGPHGDMTESALGDEGFNLNARTIGRADNWFMDMYGTAGSNPYSGHADLLKEIACESLKDCHIW